MVKIVKTPEPEGFPEFWEIWRPHARKNDGRGEARKVFAQHVKAGADPRDMIDGARYYIRSLSERDREYIPLAATWLNRGAYEDLGPQERDMQVRLANVQAQAETTRVARLPDNHFSRKWEAMKAANGEATH